VIEYLRAKGTLVTPQQVSNIKAMRVKQSPQMEDIPLSVLKKVKSLVDEIGSIRIVRKAIDELENLNIK
jgi:hypothetical protein